MLWAGAGARWPKRDATHGGNSGAERVRSGGAGCGALYRARVSVPRTFSNQKIVGCEGLTCDSGLCEYPAAMPRALPFALARGQLGAATA